MADLKQHPDYHDGFFANLEGETLPPSASDGFRAGWAAAAQAQRVLDDAGFRRTGPGSFSKTTVIKK